MKLSALISDLQSIYDHYGDVDVVSSKNREYAMCGFYNCSDDILVHTDGTIGIDITDEVAYSDVKIPNANMKI